MVSGQDSVATMVEEPPGPLGPETPGWGRELSAADPWASPAAQKAWWYSVAERTLSGLWSDGLRPKEGGVLSFYELGVCFVVRFCSVAVGRPFLWLISRFETEV